MICDDKNPKNESHQCSFIWDAIAYVPLHCDEVVIRVFMGGAGAVQIKHFINAVSRSRIDIKYKIEYINTEDVRQRFKTPGLLVDWLLGSHIHFIIAHVHQGLSHLFWSMDELRYQLTRLQYHLGFPNGEDLKCPIFTQHKMKYLLAIQDFANPTMKIILDENDNYAIIEDEIKR